MSNLPLPYQQNITGNRFKSLQVEGIPKDQAEYFFVNFNRAGYDGDKDDIAVSFEFCFNHKGYNEEIVCYTYTNGQKNIQVFSGNFPFKTMTSFAMEISTKNCVKALKVFVNDTKILEYLISIDMSSFAAVRIGGDLHKLSKWSLEVE